MWYQILTQKLKSSLLIIQTSKNSSGLNAPLISMRKHQFFLASIIHQMSSSSHEGVGLSHDISNLLKGLSIWPLLLLKNESCMQGDDVLMDSMSMEAWHGEHRPMMIMSSLNTFFASWPFVRFNTQGGNSNNNL